MPYTSEESLKVSEMTTEKPKNPYSFQRRKKRQIRSVKTRTTEHEQIDCTNFVKFNPINVHTEKQGLFSQKPWSLVNVTTVQISHDISISDVCQVSKIISLRLHSFLPQIKSIIDPVVLTESTVLAVMKVLDKEMKLGLSKHEVDRKQTSLQMENTYVRYLLDGTGTNLFHEYKTSKSNIKIEP